jgi:ABC-type microcin C transport system duplicated ATPase subunit YejF
MAGLMNGDALLKIRDLRVHSETERALVKALNGVDLMIHRGESLGWLVRQAPEDDHGASVLNLLQKDTADIKEDRP